jgi:hypothetical protein
MVEQEPRLQDEEQTMTPSDHDQGKPQDKGQAPVGNARQRTTSRRRWIKAAGLAAVPLIITVKAQPAFAQGKGNSDSKKSTYK